MIVSKTEARRWAKTLLPPSEIEQRRVVDGLVAWLSATGPTLVLVYLSIPGELAAERVAERLGSLHRFATTRTPETGHLTIHPLDAPRERHRFGYEQPVADAATIDPKEIGVVLVPGLAFDRRGNRVGWGKGYYDRLLSGVSAVKVGVTLQRRMVDEIEVEEHDVRMDLLATEHGVTAPRPPPVQMADQPRHRDGRITIPEPPGG